MNAPGRSDRPDAQRQLVARQVLARCDAHGHHERVAQGVATLADCDVVMLAQFSMAGAAAAARARVRCPVLTSPDCAVQALRAALTDTAE